MTDAEPGDAGFLDDLRHRAAASPRRLVLPEATEPRILDAAGEALREGLFHPVLVGAPEAVRDACRARGIDPGQIEIVDSTGPALIDEALAWLLERRASRRDPTSRLRKWAADPLMQAAMLVGSGAADGAVAGCTRTTADVVRAALTGVGLEEGIDTLSSAFFMAFPEGHRAGPAVLTFTDAGVVPHPDAGQLAEIAAAAVRARRSIVGDEPRVAFLSYSTHGSARGASVDVVREALTIFRELMPDVTADGELQGDAALVPAVAERKAPGSLVRGLANVLVFPDLNAANLSYKLVQHLGGAIALGPILQGLRRPFNDLSRGATAEDVAAVACITALQAG